MYASLYISAFLATVMAQAQSIDNSPLTTVTLDANAIIAPATSTPVLSTITNTNTPLTTITLPASAILPNPSVVSGSESTVLVTSVITSTVCGSCSPTPTGSVTVAPVATSIRISTFSSVTSTVRNATTSGIPYGGSNAFPVNKATTSNGTVIYTGAAQLLSAGTLAISAGVVAASYFAFAL